jgi:outer membrane protein TolC
MGETLDAAFVLDSIPPVGEPADLPALEAEALVQRPEVKVANLQQRLAEAAVASAKAAFLPQVSTLGGWEWNGGSWDSRASGWIVGATLRINVFRGFGDRARLAEAREQVTARALATQQVETRTRLDVRVAAERLRAARAREAIGGAAVAQAAESRRIVRNRYEAGLVDVVALLRASEAVVAAEAQETAARVDVLIESAALDRALGRP